MEILVLSPVWRAREEANVLALHNLFTHPECTPGPALFNDADIVRARSRGATWFLERSTADVLLWIDSDIDFRDKDALMLCQQAMNPETSVMAGIYPTRRASQAVPSSRMLLDHPYTFGSDPTPQPIQWAAGGFTAVHRRVYERLAAQDPAVVLVHPNDTTLRMRTFYAQMALRNDDESLIWGAEDWSFSERAKLVGFPSYANCAVELVHVGVYRYSLANLFTQPAVTRPIRFTRQHDGNLVEHN